MLLPSDLLVQNLNMLAPGSYTLLSVPQMNGNKEGVNPTKMNTWDKSTNSANRIDLSAV